MGKAKSDLRVQFFGHFEVWLNQKLIPDDAWPQKKVQSLLKLLLFHRPHVLTQDQIIEALFADLSFERAKQQLYSRISELRKLLEPSLERAAESSFVLREGQGYRFSDLACCWIDIEAFEDAVQQGDKLRETESWTEALSAYQTAIDLYNSDFLTEDLYEEWTLEPRERLKKITLSALDSLSECHLIHGAFSDAIDCARQALTHDPLREESLAHLMKALAHSGEESEALETFSEFVENFRSELEVEPAESLNELYSLIESGELEPLKRILPHNIPPAVTSFVGRTNELEEISRMLSRSDCRLLTLLGFGGMGKTRIGIEASRAAYEKGVFSDGVFCVWLEQQDLEEQLVHAIAEAIGFVFFGEAALVKQLCSYLKEKKMLLLIDQFETRLDEIAVLEEILSCTSHVKLLVTSREKLNLKSEWVLEIAGLAYPNQDSPDDVAEYESIRLFYDRAEQAGLDVKDSDVRLQASQIVRMLEGMPLAIELAAAMARHRTLYEIAAEVQRDLDSLSTRFKDVPARHRSIRAVFSQSWDRLSPEEQRIFLQLSVFRGGYDFRAAQEVAGASIEILDDLLDKCMIKRSSSGRYWIHELIRQYASEELRNDAELHASAENKHTDYYAQFMEDINPKLESRDQEIAYQEIGLELDNILKTWDRAIKDRAYEQIDKMLDSITGYYFYRERLVAGQKLLQSALDAVETEGDLGSDIDPLPEELSVRIFSRIVMFGLEIGSYEVFQEPVQNALISAERSVSDFECILLLLHLSFIKAFLGEVESAMILAERVASKLPALSDSENADLIKNRLAQVYIKCNKWREFHNLYPLDQISELSSINPYFLSFISGYHSVRLMHKGQLDFAFELNTRILEYSKSNSGTVAAANNMLGMIEDFRGAPIKAKKHFQKALVIGMAGGNEDLVTLCLMHLLETAISLDDKSDIAKLTSEIENILSNVENQNLVSIATRSLGVGYVRTGKSNWGIKLVEDSISLARRSSGPRYLSESLTILAELEISQDRLDIAMNLIIESVSISYELGFHLSTTHALKVFASACECQDRLKLATTYYLFLLNHQATQPRFIPEIENKIEELKTQFSSSEFEEIRLKAESLSLDEVCEEILSEHSIAATGERSEVSYSS